MLEVYKGIASLTLQDRVQSFLEKGPNLPASGPIPWICHLRRMTSSGSGKQTGHLLHPTAKDQKKVQEFLGSAGFCCIWIPGYSSLAKPLFETTAASGKDSVNWRPDQEKAFQKTKRLNQCTFTRAAGCNTAIQSPCEENHTALGVLI
jgi:hypothetical protein